jgi:hydrogenase expression/formation protein HypC
MCLAVPSKVVHILSDVMATVEVYGARKNINLMLMSDPVEEGQYVLVHAGFAIQKVDESTANEALRLIQEMADLLEAEEDPDEACGYPPAGIFPTE